MQQAAIARTYGLKTVKNDKLPLGRDTGYPHKYAPELLCCIPRAESRKRQGLRSDPPFRGVDIWNAWELTWLGKGNLPKVATAEIIVPADSTNIVESKSLKLYLNSFAMSEFSSKARIAETITKDVGACVDCPIDVTLLAIDQTEARPVSRLAGPCLDSIPVACNDWEVTPELLQADTTTLVEEDLHTHLLRSLCPVTAQPDIGSLQISYRGPKIDRASLLRYIVSYRQHNDFHEACIERMFLDIMSHCSPEALSLHGRYQRRGGIDINPFRSNVAERTRNLRLWRQ